MCCFHMRGSKRGEREIWESERCSLKRGHCHYYYTLHYCHAIIALSFFAFMRRVAVEKELHELLHTYIITWKELKRASITFKRWEERESITWDEVHEILRHYAITQRRAINTHIAITPFRLYTHITTYYMRDSQLLPKGKEREAEKEEKERGEVIQWPFTPLVDERCCLCLWAIYERESREELFSEKAISRGLLHYIFHYTIRLYRVIWELIWKMPWDMQKILYSYTYIYSRRLHYITHDITITHIKREEEAREMRAICTIYKR